MYFNNCCFHCPPEVSVISFPDYILQFLDILANNILSRPYKHHKTYTYNWAEPDQRSEIRHSPDVYKRQPQNSLSLVLIRPVSNISKKLHYQQHYDHSSYNFTTISIHNKIFLFCVRDFLSITCD